MKDYKAWMPIKAHINNSENRPPRYRERDIWICSVGENVGFEEDGKGGGCRRPVIVLKTYNREFCHVIPLSTTPKRGRYYFPFNGNTGVTSVALLSQSRAVDSSRLHDKIGYIPKEEFDDLRKCLREVLGL